jgi:hypothetical protein
MEAYMRNVKLTKVSGKPDSSIPIGYWVKGLPARAPEIGRSFVLTGPIDTSLREHFDWFKTTTVMSFDGKVITTKNSKWEIS